MVKTEVRLHCRWRVGGIQGGGKVNHPPWSVLANNDHCPADTRPLEMISGHKSLAFHFKLSIPVVPRWARRGTRSSPLGDPEFGDQREIESSPFVHWFIVPGQCILSRDLENWGGRSIVYTEFELVRYDLIHPSIKIPLYSNFFSRYASQNNFNFVDTFLLFPFFFIMDNIK